MKMPDTTLTKPSPKALDQTGGGEGAHEGHENAGHNADETIPEDGFLFARGRLCPGRGRFFPGGLDLGVGQDSVIDLPHVVADDHLVLAAGLDHLDDPFGAAEGGGVGLGFIFQHKAQPGDAMGQRDDIFLAAHPGHDIQRQFFKIFCHGSSSCFSQFDAPGARARFGPRFLQEEDTISPKKVIE